MSLRTDYKNDKFSGQRKYREIINLDGTISLEDVTDYVEDGDVFSADDINIINATINENVKFIQKLKRNIDVLLKSSNWSSSAPYKQIISVCGITSADAPIVGLKYPSNYTKQEKNNIDRCSNMITNITTENGEILFECKFDKPDTDLIITLKGV